MIRDKEVTGHMHILRFILAIMLVVSSSFGERVEAAPLAVLGDGGARIEDDGGEVNLQVDLSRAVGWRLWTANGPPRIVLELTDMTWTAAPSSASTSVAALDVVETGPHTSELHVVLREPLGIVSAEMQTAADGTAVLEICLKPMTADGFLANIGTEDKDAADNRLMIAIDPGHGGTDPGAEAGSLREADLVLAFANRLRDVLVASGHFNAMLTREDDTLLSLDARLSAARAKGADALLSVHADALKDVGAASGIVLYHLDPAAGPAANKRITERHGPDDRLSGLDLADAGQDVNVALLDLARRDTIPRTTALSASLLDTFRGAEITVNSRPERAADFAVLKAADIPSLLIELGFLSTEADLDRLTSEDWQTRTAEAIRDGLLLWAEEDRLR